MTLVPCPDCDKPVSDQAVACPECGCPTSGTLAKRRDRRLLAGLQLLGLLLLCGLMLFLFNLPRNRGRDRLADPMLNPPWPQRMDDPTPRGQRLKSLKAEFDEWTKSSNLMPDLISKAYISGYTTMMITVTDKWHKQEYQQRLKTLQKIHHQWKTTCGSEADLTTFVSLRDQTGKEVGSTGLLGNVWVQE